MNSQDHKRLTHFSLYQAYGLRILGVTHALAFSCTIILGSAISPMQAQAHEDHTPVLEELIVYGRSQQIIGSAQSASEGIVAYDDLKIPPLLRVGELAEAVPGMVATQHSGTGKANQYFLRGFNLDHGTDFSAKAGGVPINMRSHGHGQGYLDLNFLIPEMVVSTAFRKGPYSGAVGDFSSAGSVEFSFYDRLQEDVIEVSAGANGYRRGLFGASFEVGDSILTTALDSTRYAGPWDLDENLRQDKMLVSFSGQIGDYQSGLTLMGYKGEWDATDQIPERAISSGLIDEEGFIDPDLGGTTDRWSLSGFIDFESWQINAYIVDYDFSLFSNFTYFLEDPVNGDEFEQTDQRQIYGFDITGDTEFNALDTAMLWRWGVDFRYDNIDEVGLFRTNARQRFGTVREDNLSEWSIGGFAEVEVALTEKLRITGGARIDRLAWDVNAFRSANSGSGNDTQVSPKFALAYKFTDSIEGYANYGHGMHSNDVRGATIQVDPVSGDSVSNVDALVRSEGAEVGIRYERTKVFNATLVFFTLGLDSELVFVGDAGGTEVNGASTRSGIEFNSFWQLNEWLAMNLSYTHADAEFDDELSSEDRIPGAIEDTLSLGINANWSNGLYASAKVRYLGEAPLIEDNSVRSEPSTLINLGIGYRTGQFELGLDLFNATDSNDTDISYFYESRLAGEPAGGIADQHFRPLEPRTVRGSIKYYW